MLQDARIKEIALEVARTDLPDWLVEDALIQAAMDSQGGDALRITLVVQPFEWADDDGDSFLRFLVDLHSRLEREGEERLPIPTIATRDDLAVVSDDDDFDS